MKTIFLAFGLLAVFIGLLVCLRQLRVEQPPPIVVTSQGPATIERLERLSQLVTSRVYVADVLIGEGEGCRGAWLIRGDSLLAVNMSKATITEQDKRPSVPQFDCRNRKSFRLAWTMKGAKPGRSRRPPGFRGTPIKTVCVTRYFCKPSG